MKTKAKSKRPKSLKVATSLAKFYRVKFEEAVGKLSIADREYLEALIFQAVGDGMVYGAENMTSWNR